MIDSQFHNSFSKETWEQFKSDQRDGPIHMLNLIRLREKAEYSDGRDATGAEAYQVYSDLSALVFQKLAGRIVWRGEYELVMVGPKAETWDIAFIAEYPCVQAFMDMVKSNAYRVAMSHRQAGVLDSRLIRFASDHNGVSFAE